MQLDEIREAFETAEWAVPADALRAALSRAKELAPAVIAVCADAAAGVYLLPRQDRFHFFGLYAVSAARETSVYPTFLRLLERPERELSSVLGFDYPTVIQRVLLSVFDGNADPLYALIERPEIDSSVRATMFDVLARLVWEGRTARDRFLELLDRFDRASTLPAHDVTWIGWEDAVAYLGLREFASRVRRGWDAGRPLGDREIDRQDWVERLERAIAEPQHFVDDRVAPIDDPVEALDWLARLAARPDPDPPDPDDPAADICLTRAEIQWLDGFLLSDKAPSDMSMEHIDGFFTALLCGPMPTTPTIPAVRMAQVWGPDGDPRFDNQAQREHVMTLLGRQWAAIEVRLDLGAHLSPIINHEDEPTGSSWAFGFTEAIEADPEPWGPLLANRTAGDLIFLVSALVLRAGDKPLSTKARQAIIEKLPLIPLRIREFWRSPETFGAPVRVAKVGRNDPCPCGSGRKYKKCCGAGRTPSS